MDEIIHMESVDLTLRTSSSWDSRSAPIAPHRVFISWKSPPPTFLKVNFDDGVLETYGGASFVIKDPDSRLVAASCSHLFSPSIPMVELHAA